MKAYDMSLEKGTSSRSGRLVAVDIARAFAIVLVVIGHWDPSVAPEGWVHFVKWIYTFHMPLFLFVSGYLFARSPKPYGLHIKGKVRRLLVPYFTTSVIIITIKLLSPGEIDADHPVTPLAYLEMFWRPSAGFFLWFIWVLWWCFVIVPLFRTRRSRLCFFVVCAVASYLPWNAPDIFCLNLTRRMMLWFVGGVAVYDFRELIPLDSRQVAMVSGVVFLVLSAVFLGGVTEVEWLLPYAGCIGIISSCWSLEHLLRGRFLSTLLSISAASYIIYLFHTTFQGPVKALLFRYVPGMTFSLMTIIVIAAGVVVPWWLYRSVLFRFRITRLLFGLGK